MMSTDLAAALTAGGDVGDAAQAQTPPRADGANAFASVLDAVAADVPVVPEPTTPVEADAAATSATDLVAEVTKDPVEGVPVSPPVDPMILFGMSRAAPAPTDRPLFVAGQPCLRDALERSAAEVSQPASDTGTAMIDARESLGERDIAATVQLASHETDEAARTSTDVAPVERFTLDGVPTVLMADPPAGAKPAADSSPRVAPPPVTVPMQSPDWSREFAARVSWMVERGEQFASIQLTPAQLGPVEVRLAIREGEASIWFGAAQADTRAAIEQALPRLREMFAASGLVLADASVFQGSPRDPRHGLVRADARRAAGESTEPVPELSAGYRRSGLIDEYA
jgi:flagellar hook-length control protein FliK